MQLPRQIRNSLPPLLLFFAAQKVCAQIAPAVDFFNSGAQLYISNNVAQAKDVVEMGLKLYPDDDKLKKLEELLKQQQQSQSSQSQQNQQQKQQQQSQSQQNSNSQKSQQQQQNSQDQKKPDEQKQNPAEQQKQSEQQKADAEKKSEDQKAEGQPVAGQMTPQEAKRLLDAQKDGEQVLQLKPQAKPENPNRPFKDW